MNILSKTIVLIGVFTRDLSIQFWHLYARSVDPLGWTISGLILHGIGSRNPTHFA